MGCSEYAIYLADEMISTKHTRTSLGKSSWQTGSKGSFKKIRDCCALSASAAGSLGPPGPGLDSTFSTSAEKSRPPPRSFPLLTVTFVGGSFPRLASTSNWSTWKSTVGPGGSVLATAGRLLPCQQTNVANTIGQTPSTKAMYRDAAVVRNLRTPRTQVASIRRNTRAVSNQHEKSLVEHLLITTSPALCCLGVILSDNYYVAERT
jgi:hypothetical protein